MATCQVRGEYYYCILYIFSTAARQVHFLSQTRVNYTAAPSGVVGCTIFKLSSNNILKSVCAFLSHYFADGDDHPLELDPLMLTILGIVAGVLIVIVIVTLAIRIHASRSRGRLRGGGLRTSADGGSAGGANSGGNKVVVTTIEELDIDHHSSTASLMVMDHGGLHRGSEQSVRSSSNALRSSSSASTSLGAKQNNPDLVPFIQQQQSKFLFRNWVTLLLRVLLLVSVANYCCKSSNRKFRDWE